MSKPLPEAIDGIKVVEFGQNLAGPYCGQILAFLGADVVKVERPEGDDARKWGPPFVEGDAAELHRAQPRQEVDHLRSRRQGRARGSDRAHRRGGHLRAQSAGPTCRPSSASTAPTLTKRFPRLIYADLGAFGHVGPWKERPGYEPIIQAVAGLDLAERRSRPGPEARIGVSIIDLSTGMWTAIGVLAALAQRTATGRGSLVNTSLFESGLMWASNHVAVATR